MSQYAPVVISGGITITGTEIRMEKGAVLHVDGSKRNDGDTIHIEAKDEPKTIPLSKINK